MPLCEKHDAQGRQPRRIFRELIRIGSDRVDGTRYQTVDDKRLHVIEQRLEQRKCRHDRKRYGEHGNEREQRRESEATRKSAVQRSSRNRSLSMRNRSVIGVRALDMYGIFNCRYGYNNREIHRP